MGFVYEYVRKNDGRPSPYSAEQDAISHALNAFYSEGFYPWKTITIENLACDNRDKADPESHYPDSCWHHRVTIVPGEDVL